MGGNGAVPYLWVGTLLCEWNGKCCVVCVCVCVCVCVSVCVCECVCV